MRNAEIDQRRTRARLRPQAGIPWLARGWEPALPKPVQLLTHDFPMRPDLIVRCTLPVDLTPGEAQRIEAFVQALAFPA